MRSPARSASVTPPPATLAEKNDRIIGLMQQIQRNLNETNERLAEIKAAMERREDA